MDAAGRPVHRPVHQPDGETRAGARIRLFPDYVAFRAQSVSCRCGWRGAGRLAEPGRLFDIGVEIKCPCCTVRLGVAIFAPTPRLPSRAEVPADPATGAAPRGLPGRVDCPALGRMLDLFESMSADEHARAHALLGSGLALDRDNWIASYFDGYCSESLPAVLEGHLPAAFARVRS
ncbi:MAG: hypothetical protein AB7P21_11775 [Lautropia sp.]